MTTLQATLNTLYFSVRYAFHGLESMTERQEGYLTGYGEALKAVARLQNIDPDSVTTEPSLYEARRKDKKA